MIDLYIFDQGGVLLRDFYVLPEAAARLGMQPEELRRLLPPDMFEYSRGMIDGPEFWRLFEVRTGIKVPEDYWRTLFSPRADPPTFALLRELASSSRVVCGTNTIDCHHEIIGRLGLYDCYHKVYASHLMHLVKPESAFWLRILEEEGVAAERAFFADDTPANVEAAGRLGIHAQLYVDAATLRRDLAAVGAPVSAPAI